MVSSLLLAARAVMLLVAALLMLPSAAAAQTTALFYDSLVGDVVGEGQRRTILPGDATPLNALRAVNRRERSRMHDDRRPSSAAGRPRRYRRLSLLSIPPL